MATQLVEALNTYMLAAATAIATGDYSTALSNASAAQALAAGLPSEMSRSAGAGGGTQSVKWDSAKIDAFIVRVRQMQGASIGVQARNIVPTSATTTDTD